MKGTRASRVIRSLGITARGVRVTTYLIHRDGAGLDDGEYGTRMRVPSGGAARIEHHVSDGDVRIVLDIHLEVVAVRVGLDVEGSGVATSHWCRREA